jgi:hypothetical protein
MRSTIILGTLLPIVLFGCTEVDDLEKFDAKVIQAIRVGAAPVLDGKLDDTCWKKAVPITGFLDINSERLTSYQSFGQVCYDDTYLYIGMKCLMPKGLKPKGIKRPDDGHLFSDDSVEIMIDPGRTMSKYFQLAANAYESTYDSVRQSGGAQNDQSWEGDWDIATHIGDGYWSVEIAVPFYNLAITPETGSTWGLNLCRNIHVPHVAYTTTGSHGAYTNAPDFAIVKGIDVDFNRYLYQIGPGKLSLQSGGESPEVLYEVPVVNTTGKDRTIKIDRILKDDSVESTTLLLEANKSISFPEVLAASSLVPTGKDVYAVDSDSKVKKIVISDAKTGVMLAASNLKRPWFCEAMKIIVDDPWHRKTKKQKTKSVSLKVHTNIAEIIQTASTLQVALRSETNGKALASKTFNQPANVTEVTFETSSIPWGAYLAVAEFQDSDGNNIVSSQTLVTILPGEKHYVKVLNNFVSELMNTQQRGMDGEKKIAFMNPRSGWVFFNITGKCEVKLDGESKPLALGKAQQYPGEAMRYLSAGRHSLQIEGIAENVIIRSVGQIVYASNVYRYSPKIMNEALANANILLGGSQAKAAFMHEWTDAGKKILAFAAAPSHRMIGNVRIEDQYVSAEDCYEQITSHKGFADPLRSGVMVDQIGSATPVQKVAIARALGRIAANPEFKNKIYCPWYEGGIGSSGPNRAMDRVISSAGWPFSFYRYLPEQPTEQAVEKQIQDNIINTLLASEKNSPGAIRKAVVTLGYMSDVAEAESQNCNPGTNFQTLMQMQVETLAKHPDVFGIFGASWYYSPYVDEENLRWAGRLFRHYCIEGKTKPLSNDPYVLGHITNPDFEDGMNGWNISEAEPGAVTTKTLAGFGTIEGRYLGGTHGDTFLLTKRDAKKPNTFSQEIKGLTPGRAYSLKMITADYENITAGKSVAKLDAVSVKLDNVELLPGVGRNKQKTYQNKLAEKNFLNFHWYVFRAQAAEATLTVSDWETTDSPGAAAGTNTMFNFIEIQPYLE